MKIKIGGTCLFYSEEHVSFCIHNSRVLPSAIEEGTHLLALFAVKIQNHHVWPLKVKVSAYS